MVMLSDQWPRKVVLFIRRDDDERLQRVRYTCQKMSKEKVAVNSSQLVQLGLKLFEYTNHLSNVKLPGRNSFFEWGNLLFTEHVTIFFRHDTHAHTHACCDQRTMKYKTRS